jgi:nucleotide-binding universal stress UspA family protein
MPTTTHRTPAGSRRLEVRPLDKEDVEQLDALCQRQSSDSLRRQFFDPSPPTRDRLDRLTAQDDDRRVALVAVAGGALVGAARYDRLDAGDSADAWLFVDEAVADPQVEVRLLTELARIAREAAIRRLLVEVHPLDRELLETLDAAPLHTERHLHCGIVTVTVRLDPVAPRARPEVGDPAALLCRSVLVPVDSSPFAETAVAAGDWLARRIGAELHVATAVLAHDPSWDDHYLARLRSTYRRAQTHRWTHPDIAGGVARLAAAVGPTVLCAATHGRSRSASVFGSTFLAIARATNAPLVAVGQEARPPHAPELPIVVCVDGSVASESVLPGAATWARRLGVPLDLVTVADADGGPDAEPVRFGAARRDAAAYLEELLARPELAGLTAGAEVLSDRVAPHHAIADRLARRPATLVALASRARTGLGRMLVGSEAARIVQSSPVPVLVHRVAAGGA